MKHATTKALSGVAALAAAGVGVVGLAGPASAHHPIVSGAAVCDEETGRFDVTWSIGNSESDKVMTFTTDRSSVPGGEVDEGGTVVRQEEVDPGTYTLTVDASWPNGVEKDGSATVTAQGECEKPQPEQPEPSETQQPTEGETTTAPPATGPGEEETEPEEPATTEADVVPAGPATQEQPAGPVDDAAGPGDGVPTRIPAGGGGDAAETGADTEAASYAGSGDAVDQAVVVGLVGVGALLAAVGGVIGALRARARQR